MSTFCAEHEISRKTFYAIRARARVEGQAAVLEPRSRRPRTSPTQINDQVQQEALAVRAALASSGLDNGPISVHDKMRAVGMAAPSPASLARIFRHSGVARRQPNKRPRAAWRRFVYPAPNACWQLDATDYVLTGGRTCVIFQVEDDHSRLALASHVAPTETAQAAVHVVAKAIAAHGVPQRLLSDNGSALNASRRGGAPGRLVAYLTSLGVQPITGKPGKPTTQGKNERFHKTLFRWLDEKPMARTMAELQAQVDAFDIVYNTQRPHQGLPGRITPQQAWNATDVAEPPRPRPVPPPLDVPTSVLTSGGSGTRTITVQPSGSVRLHGIKFHINTRLAGHTLHAAWDLSGITFADTHGAVLLAHPWPPAGTTYLSNGNRPGKPHPPSPKS